MREAVSDVLVERSRTADGLSRMVTYSLVAHVGLVAIVAFLPPGWIGTTREPDAAPMMISLNTGSPGPDTGGKNQIAGRVVQKVGEEAPKQPFAVPPASKAPEMVVPEPKPKPAPKSSAEKPSPSSPTRKPITGPEVKPGERIDTRGAAVPFGGLSSSGGQGLGAELTGMTDFCCPDYLETMLQLIRRNWDQKQNAAGLTVVRFVIRRDGMLANVEVVKSSNNVILDMESRRAVLKTAQLPPLPAQYTNPTLTIHLRFDYQQ